MLIKQDGIFVLYFTRGKVVNYKQRSFLMKELFCNYNTLFYFCPRIKRDVPLDAKRNKKIKAATKKAEK